MIRYCAPVEVFSHVSLPHHELFAATTLLVAGVASCSTPSTGDDATLLPSRSGTLATTSAATAPTPEEDYLAALNATGRFPNVEGDARQLWLRYGRDACRRLDVTGDIVQTRFAVADALADWSPRARVGPNLGSLRRRSLSSTRPTYTCARMCKRTDQVQLSSYVTGDRGNVVCARRCPQGVRRDVSSGNVGEPPHQGVSVGVH